MDAIRRLGFDVVDDVSFTAARGEFDMATKTFTYNPQRMTRLDVAHEWRHFRQLRALEQRGLRYDKKLKPLLERGAYRYEERLWRRLGRTPTAAYLDFHLERSTRFGHQLWQYVQLSRRKQAYRGIWH
jgi:hypothetical protein